MVLNPGQLPPPALRLPLPRASSRAAPGDAGRIFPRAARRVRSRSPQPQPAPCFGSPAMKVPKSVPSAAFPGGTGGWQLCARAASGCGSRRLNTPGLDIRVHGGMGVSRGECVCVQRKGRLVKLLFPLLFFFLSIFFSRGGCCGVAWHE